MLADFPPSVGTQITAEVGKLLKQRSSSRARKPSEEGSLAGVLCACVLGKTTVKDVVAQ